MKIHLKWCGPGMDGSRPTTPPAAAWAVQDSAPILKSPRPRKRVNYHGLSNGPRRTAGLGTMCKSRSSLIQPPPSTREIKKGLSKDHDTNRCRHYSRPTVHRYAPAPRG